MKICWISDIHLNFLPEEKCKEFFESVRLHDSDCVFLTGDISESPVLPYHLTMMDQIVSKPVYFVLGNHDYWYTSIDHMKENLPKFLNQRSFLKWLTITGPLMLEPGVCVIGHDGWYDCRHGSPEAARFIMHDWSVMGDYVDCKNINQVIDKSKMIADQGIEHLKKHINDAATRFRKIVILTHVPPYEETHVHMGKQGDAFAQPFFTNAILGGMLKAAAKAYPTVEFIVLAGHTHGKVTKQILSNLVVHVAGAEYGSPGIQSLTTI